MRTNAQGIWHLPAKLRQLVRPNITTVTLGRTILRYAAKAAGYDWRIRNQNHLIQILAGDGLELIAVADQFLTDTARYADIFLPSTPWFEEEDVRGHLSLPDEDGAGHRSCRGKPLEL